jgi:hypothetical protein
MYFLSLTELAEYTETLEFRTESLRGGFCPNHCAARLCMDIAYYHPFINIQMTPLGLIVVLIRPPCLAIALATAGQRIGTKRIFSALSACSSDQRERV